MAQTATTENHENKTMRTQPQIQATGNINGIAYVSINPTQIERAYSGKPGCMCGCLGTYTEKQSGINMRVKNAIQALKDGLAIRVFTCREFISIETETRNWCFYYPEGK